MVHVHLPTALRSLADDRSVLHVEAMSLVEVFDRIDGLAPMLRSQIFDATGTIRPFVGVFLDDRQIGELHGDAWLLRAGSQVRIVMSVAGG